VIRAAEKNVETAVVVFGKPNKNNAFLSGTFLAKFDIIVEARRSEEFSVPVFLAILTA